MIRLAETKLLVRVRSVLPECKLGWNRKWLNWKLFRRQCSEWLSTSGSFSISAINVQWELNCIHEELLLQAVEKINSNIILMDFCFRFNYINNILGIHLYLLQLLQNGQSDVKLILYLYLIWVFVILLDCLSLLWFEFGHVISRHWSRDITAASLASCNVVI